MIRILAILLPLWSAPLWAAHSVNYYRDIRPIIEAKCLACHAQGSVAFSYEDPERAYDFRAAIVGAVGARRMPPWMAEPGHQRYLNDYSLSDAQLALFERWGAQGYPKGRKRRSNHDANVSVSFVGDVTVALPGSRDFLPDQAHPDDYRCFVAQWPLDRPAYVTGIGATPGNARISHHAIIYIGEPSHLPVYQEFVAAEGGQGYRCFGGPVADRLAEPGQREAFVASHKESFEELANGQYWLAHWAPGMEGYDLPPGTGIPVKPGATVVVQMHYFSGFAPNERDAGTVLHFKTAEQVAKPAMNWPLSRSEWLQGKSNNSLVVPAKGKSSVSFAASLLGLDQYIAVASGRPLADFDRIEIHSVNLHMHLIGAAGRVRLLHDDTAEILLNVPRYQFGWQRDFFLAQPRRVALDRLDATKLEVQCEFANPGTEPVYGGYGSKEEMCYNFSLLALAKGEDQSVSDRNPAP